MFFLEIIRFNSDDFVTLRMKRESSIIIIDRSIVR